MRRQTRRLASIGSDKVGIQHIVIARTPPSKCPLEKKPYVCAAADATISLCPWIIRINSASSSGVKPLVPRGMPNEAAGRLLPA